MLICFALIIAAPNARMPNIRDKQPQSPTEWQKVRTVDASAVVGPYEWFNDRFIRLGYGGFDGTFAPGLTKTRRWKLHDANTGNTVEFSWEAGQWMTEHGELFFGGKPTYINPHNDMPLQAVSDDLIYFDGEYAAFELSNKSVQDEHQHFFVWWNVAKKQSEFVVPFGPDSMAFHKRMSPDRKQFYWFRAQTSNGQDTETLHAIDIERKKLRQVSTVVLGPTPRHSGNFFFNRDMSRVVFVEYTEKSFGPVEPPPHLFVIDTTTGAQTVMEIPVSAYGIAFSPDNKVLYVGSNEKRTFERYDLEAKTTTLIAKDLGRIGNFNWSPQYKTLFVMSRDRPLQRWSMDGVKPKPQKPMPWTELFPGKKKIGWDASSFSPNETRVLVAHCNDEGFEDEAPRAFTLFQLKDTLD